METDGLFTHGHDPGQLERLASDLKAIRLSAYWMEQEFEAELAKVAEVHQASARNLLHYIALRRRDLRVLQEELASLGLSSLGRAESHVLGTLDPLLAVLYGLLGKDFDADDGLRPCNFVDGRMKLRLHTEALFGDSSRHRDDSPVRIMVTMPSEAAVDYEVVHGLVANGMSCMRINCSHDDIDAWMSMVQHLDRARSETGKHCSLLMDLGGPKIRTGQFEPGPRVIHWEPKRSILGEVIAPTCLWLTPADMPELSPFDGAKTLPLDRDVLRRLESKDRIVFRDLRNCPRSLTVLSSFGDSWVAQCDEITYLGADTPLAIRPWRAATERDLPAPFFAAILPVEQALSLTADDELILTRSPVLAHSVVRGTDGQLSEEPRISCTSPEVFEFINPGERVIFDDGKISCVVLSACPDELRLRVTHPVAGQKKLRADKGLNLPESKLEFPALTDKDLVDLDFVAEHADMIGFSFVNQPSDVEQLQREIARRTSRDVGIVLKIETQQAFQHLPHLLLTALRSERVGVMIARGDLAVECGYERLAELQEEILWICEAAHVPVIWATQVLDRLSKKGVPTRAEVTDAAMGERAECVMLNKGPHIAESVRLLSDIVARMRGHQDKKTPRMRALSISFPVVNRPKTE